MEVLSLALCRGVLHVGKLPKLQLSPDHRICSRRRGRAAPVKPGAVTCLCLHALFANAMAMPVHDLEAEALLLPPEDRARLLERLIASFESRSSAQRAWLDLAQRRRADVAAGKVTMLPGDEALARVRARVA